jgi:flagellar biogenesis protein FliO
MRCLKSIILAIQIILLCNCFLMGQEAKPESFEPLKPKTAEDKETSSEDVSTNDYLNGKTSDKNSKNKDLFSVADKTRISWGSYLQMFLVLTFILFLIFLFVYFTKGKFRKNLMGLNGIEVLAKTSILPKQTMLLVRVGPRILVLNASADGHMRTLSEFTNQEEIDRLLSEINKSSRDNIFQSLLTRNQVMYDEDAPKEKETLDKIDKETDKILRK